MIECEMTIELVQICSDVLMNIVDDSNASQRFQIPRFSYIRKSDRGDLRILLKNRFKLLKSLKKVRIQIRPYVLWLKTTQFILYASRTDARRTCSDLLYSWDRLKAFTESYWFLSFQISKVTKLPSNELLRSSPYHCIGVVKIYEENKINFYLKLKVRTSVVVSRVVF